MSYAVAFDYLLFSIIFSFSIASYCLFKSSASDVYFAFKTSFMASSLSALSAANSIASFLAYRSTNTFFLRFVGPLFYLVSSTSSSNLSSSTSNFFNLAKKLRAFLLFESLLYFPV